MRSFLLSLALTISLVAAFAPQAKVHRTQTQIDAVNRREALWMGVSSIPILAGIAAFPQKGAAFQQQLDDHLTEPTQLPTGGKYDLNSAYVGDYMQLKGMYPKAAGKIASNGPYTQVSDIYKIDNLTDNDVKMFKKYEKLFTVNPPGRAFKERINARVST
mmetsp:Transcript_2674/g.4010  ORF Transcript_2674/g.4010 Transcript_2674/m.4010 type:complete len:160 (+) Transcript_2674:145-624(+)|eukprot:CAMPEP_0197241648 /NCGR_PEP_ID=MMETSP1429-20130617/7624_1 /TAXON_ID=49237 /ORGANISM="Chaetoceros  sp., Strain UNC1202" /LENGTH=159 /DNA_ID=CAMNT_0042701513 /DNA_START=95 /DNA_END=574 /DNA_ORIENTATION=+